MLTNHRTLAATGALLATLGLALLVWYRTAVLDSAEIDRLEAGGQSASNMTEFLLLLASPVLVLTGLGLVVLAWSRSRRRPGADDHDNLPTDREATRR